MPEGHHPRGTTLREALRGNLPLRGLCGVLSEGSAGVSPNRLMSRGKNCLPTVLRQFLTRNYPRPNCLLKCLPNCLSPTREGFLSSFKISPAVRTIARQVRDKNCLAAIFAPRHQSVSSGPLGSDPMLVTLGNCWSLGLQMPSICCVTRWALFRLTSGKLRQFWPNDLGPYREI